MNGVGIGLIVAYLLACIAIGIIAQRRMAKSAQSGADYYVAGRSVSTWVNSLAILSATGSGGTFLASVGTIWNVGLAWYAWAMGGSIVGFTIASILVARTYRSTKRTTVASYLALRFPSSRILVIGVPVVIVIGTAMYLISQMSAGGLVASYVTGLPFEWALVVIAVVFIIYTSMGGMLAVTWTNVLQGMMVLLLTAILAGFGLAAMPVSWGDFIQAAADMNPIYGTAGDGMSRLTYAGAFVTWAAAICVTPHIITRAFTAKSVRSSMVSLNGSMVLFGVVLLALGLIVTPHISGLDPADLEGTRSDMWTLLIAEMLVPEILLGLIVAGILAAIMSTVDALLLAVSSSVGHDLYNVFAKDRKNDKTSVRIATASSWAIGILCLLLTLNPPELLMLFYTAAIGLFVSCLFVPVVAGMWWKHINPAGAAAGFLTGLIVFGVLYGAFDMPSNSEVLVALPLSFIATIVVSLVAGGEKADVVAHEKQTQRQAASV
ncbi:sodium:solute symporter family protein [Citricoccus sp.]|uniref:sodium:solute symporter family protein n=1 Tax=Citricoccus sp. TaxID=1978372 RepID=UPI0028BF279E|nr:sodium:solute symporter family protein [Citricoccus sp.]